jgi:hypothetical protein
MNSRARRIVAAVVTLLTLAACADPSLVAPPDITRAALFDEVWHQTDLTYSMFTLKGVNWDSVRAVYRPRAIAASNDAALAQTLAAMLMTLRDRHVSFTAGGSSGPIAFHATGDGAPSGFDAALIDRTYLRDTSRSSAHVRVGMVASTVGYIRIPSFSGDGWAGEIDAALESLGAVPYLIVDVRNNLGGDYELALDVAGRFADRSRPFGYVKTRNGAGHDDFADRVTEVVKPRGPAQFHGTVLLLTNRRAYSSAENFTLAMRELPNVLTIGDTTGGSSGKPVARELANGWTYQLSTWVEYALDGTPIEDRGVAPSIVVTAPADPVAGVDPTMEQALRIAGAR